MTQQPATESTILIITSRVIYFEPLFDYLRRQGVIVFVAENGQVGLQAAFNKLPHGILLDCTLSDPDSFDICRRVKANEKTKDLPVIFMACRPDPDDKANAFEVGAAAYVVDPVLPQEVLAQFNPYFKLSFSQPIPAESARPTTHSGDTKSIGQAEILSEIDDFTYMVAHNLKNPLGVVISYAEYLTKYSTSMSDDERLRDLMTIRNNGFKMERIIDELRLLVSVHLEQVTPHVLDTATLIYAVRQRLAPLIKEHRAEVVVPSEWPEAMGYHRWIEEVWINFISNAIRNGGIPPKVRLGATPHPDGLVEFWVLDNGPDLTPEQKAELFKPLTRLSQVNARGSGLGLSVVNKVIEKLGGRVSVEPGSAGGKKFSFYLPKATFEYNLNDDE